ncbi:hypothetical protein CP533_5231 [Ophiocordyceps camponoti-saundersi (nom. inval.)]|nr:hypothetical protein CP533_5231 [Ophiocordyceps camponoti-saundersi (nom. inval.)]
MLRQFSARLRPTLGPLSRRAGRRRMATVRVEGIPKEPTDLDQVTRLPNGLRVVSEPVPGSFSGVGIYIEAGSRYEDERLRGVSHLVDRLAFKSTPRHTADAMMERVDALGGNIHCSSSREAMMYQAASFNRAVPETVALLAETIRDPCLSEAEVAEQVETARYEIAEIWDKPELILPELLHTAAFKDNTLGNPLLCPEERLPFIDRQTILSYRESFYQPERFVLAFAGVNHGTAVKLAEQYFGDMTSTTTATTTTGSRLSSSSSSSSSSTSTSSSKIPLFKNLSTTAAREATVLDGALPPQDPILTQQPAHYTGGFLSMPPQQASLTSSKLTYIHLAFEGLSVKSDDIYALATLQTLLGGGGSFSAGGPGKGMYSRLFTNVLNYHGWVESCVAFNHSYTDSGLFGISAMCQPGQTGAMLDLMCHELRALTVDEGHAALRPDEVQRAKNQLRSSLLMNLESRMVGLEDLGRSVQVHGRKLPVRDVCRRIEALTVRDLRRVADLVVHGKVSSKGRGSGAPTVVVQEARAYGVTSHGMSWDQIQDRIDRWGLGRRA